MKVGIDVSQAVYGTGVSDYTIELVNNLKKITSVVPVGFSLRRQSELKKLFPDASVFPIPPTALHLLWNRLHIVNFENFTPGKIDIYHSSDWTQAPDSTRKITTVHDLTPFIYPAEHHSRIVAVHKARMHWVVRECDAVICVSENTAADFARLFAYPRENIHVIPEALPSRFEIVPGPSPYENYLVAIGTRQPRKNIDRLVSAFIKYQSRYRLPEKLVIIGEKPPRESRPDPSVIFTGYVSDQELADLLAGAVCFVYPSLYEGFGIPVLISFYHHVPVACSRTSSFPEVAGSAAAYFNPADGESIALGVQKAIKNHKQIVTLGTAQLQKFSWAQTAQATLQFYNSIL